MQKLAQALIQKHGIQDSFYICSMATLADKINQWTTCLPNIKPFYAVKCNPNKEVVNYMIQHNMGFDCASKTEIDMVLKLGAHSKDIIYAHPCKRVHEMEQAVSHGVQLTTFDNHSELIKIKQHAPHISCLIRLKIDNPTARVQLGLKYGARQDEYQSLIDTAKEMNLNVTGAAFHVGSASKDPIVFHEAIQYSREVFEYAKQKGFLMNTLDIGGGFTRDNFNDCANMIRHSIDDAFKDEPVNIIAEPGRFFAEDTFTFCVPIIGKRVRDNMNEYWIADGLYGSFNCILYDGQVPTFEALGKEDAKKVDSMLFFETCDSLDSFGRVTLPELEVGDFLMVERFGAYTIAGAMDFNGINMSKTKIFYI